MKQILLAAAIFLSTTSFTEDPNEKVLSAFEKTFTQVSDLKWQDVDNNFEASFTQADVRLRVQYDQEGNLTRSIRYYKGNMLPIIIQSAIQKKYPSKKIHSVTEMSTSEEISYHIILEDESTWLNINSDVFGNLAVEGKYKKG
jgi:hypothetical protein